MSVSPSALQRLDVCPASGALPQVRYVNADMQRGTIVHDFLDRMADGDRDAALAAVPEEHREFCASIPLDRVPFDVTRVITEPAFALSITSGRVRSLGRRINRQYGQLAADEIAGSMDVLIVADDAVHIWDWKVGFGVDLLAPPPERNIQMRTYALMGARAHGVDSATIGRIRIDEDGRVWPDEPVILDAFDLADVLDQVRGIHARVQRAREEILTGRTPSVTQSGWCRYCPAFVSCPAQTALVRQLATAPAEIEQMVEALTPEVAAKAYHRLRQVEEVAARVRKAVEAYASQHPVDLGNGRELALVETTRESIDAEVALTVLQQEFGDGVVEAAVSPSVTKAALKAALKPWAEQQGVSLAKAERQAMGELRAAGGIVEKTTQSVRERKTA